MDNRSQPSKLGHVLGLCVLALSACATEAPDEGDGTTCEAGKCDGLPFLEQLKGKDDPIAKFFRQLHEAGVIDDKGVYHGDKAGEIGPTNDPLFYAKVLEGLAKVQGCRPESLINYAISDDLISGSSTATYPRLISTVCSENNDLVTNAFVATLGSPDGTGDLDLEDLELFAWDATQQKYFFYATKPGAEEGQLEIEVDPARCAECHLTPRDTDPVGMPRLPIMNELTKPWTHWNAGDGGVSDSFLIPEDMPGKAKWEKFGARAGAASRLEKAIRDANALRVTPTRAKNLFRPAKLEEAMGLIRPLFCDEQYNYASELATGEITMDAVVSGGIKNAFRGIQSTWSFEWFNHDNLQLPPTANESDRLFLIPVRGVADVTFEPQLQAILSPAHVLAVRALDWKKPVFSTFRCNLWRDALTAFRANPPALTGRNRDAVKVLFEEIMKKGGMSTRNLAAGKFISLPEATEAAVRNLKAAVAAGTVPASCGEFCEVDANGFGGQIEAHVNSVQREALLTERDRRVCSVVEEVEPVGTHKDHGRGFRVPNEPSFLRVPQASRNAVETIPEGCRP